MGHETIIPPPKPGSQDQMPERLLLWSGTSFAVFLTADSYRDLKCCRGLFTTSTARDLLAAPPTHTTKHHAQIPCFSQWTTRLQPGMLPTNFPRITPSQRLNVHSASSLGKRGIMQNDRHRAASI